MDVSVVLERGSEGYLAWVVELPGCHARAPQRDAALAKVPTAVREFLGWLRESDDLVGADISVVAVDEVETRADVGDGDTEILLEC